MPIYEFYCADCHTIFNFFSRRINTETIPACPKCGRSELERQMSVFAVSKGRKEEDDNPLGDIDESKMERAMAALAGELEGIDENDPKQAARLMRKLYDTTGLNLGGGMEEALRRMEAGEDPDKIEEELGDILEEEDPFAAKSKQGLNELRRKYLPPHVDKTLYDLE
jgi:putative FmdB family regulatory protein